MIAPAAQGYDPVTDRELIAIEAPALVAVPSQDDAWQITTTCHADASIEEALAHLLRAACPADAYWDECRAAVALVVGLPDVAERVREALADPRDFLRIG